MSQLILGISVFGHDSACALISGDTGEVLCALTEERFSNIKHDGRFPTQSIRKIRALIEDEGLGQVTHLAFNIDSEVSWGVIYSRLENLLLNLEERSIAKEILGLLRGADLLEDGYFPLNYIRDLLATYDLDAAEVRSWLDTAIWHGNFAIRNSKLIEKVQGLFPGAEVSRVDHHSAHAASAYFCSGFSDSAILTLDGQGELATATLAMAKGHNIDRLAQTDWPHSLGALYMQLTWYLGFDGDDPRYRGFGDEFKVMGMGAYGEPVFLDDLRQLGMVDDDGRFVLLFGNLVDLVPVQGCRGHSQPVLSAKFFERFGPRREKGDPLEQRHYDLAVSGQAFLEEVGLSMAKALRRKVSTTENICIAGGVGLNGLMNMRILKEAGFSDIFIQPAAGDDGTSLGAALYVYHCKMERPSNPRLSNAFLGLDYGEDAIAAVLEEMGIPYERPASIHKVVAGRLHDGAIVARYVGRGEFGPRALGHRSILANPTLPGVKDAVNAKIKHREAFRPFAPACLAERAVEFFDVHVEAPYMLLIAEAQPGIRERIPAVVHDDNTGRIQTVSLDENPDFYAIISAFNELTGTPVLLNTSFNVNGEAIVETPRDAIESFLFMGIDFLAIGPYLVSREDIGQNDGFSDRLALIQRRRDRYNTETISPESYFWSTSNPPEIEMQLLREQVHNLEKIAEERLQLIKRLDDHINKGRK